MQLATKIAYNTLIQFGGKIITTGLSLIAVAAITRYLGRVGFGQYTTIITFLSFFAILADFGLTLVTSQLISRPNTDEEKILGNLLAWRLVSAIIFLGLAPIMVLFFPYSAEIKIGVAIASSSFIFIALNQVLVGFFQKRLRMDRVSFSEVISRTVLVVGILAVVKFDWGLFGILWVTVASAAVNFLFHFLFACAWTRLKLRFDFSLWRKIFITAWPLAVTTALNLIYLKTDILFLSLLSRPTKIGLTAEVGLYGVAYRVIDVLVTFPFMFAGIILPILTYRWARADYQGFKQVLQKSFDVMAFLAVPLAVGTQLTAQEIITLVAGPDFAAAGKILQVLIVAAAAIFLGVVFSHAVIALDKQKQIIKAYLFTAVTAVAGYLIFIPYFSYFGAAAVTVYSEIAIAVANAWLVWRVSGFRPRLNVFFKSFLAAIIMAGFIYIWKLYGWPINSRYNFLVAIGLGSGIYFFCLYLFGGLKREDILSLFNKKT
jgi:O-antigen/teichoic acid export membrane protein